MEATPYRVEGIGQEIIPENVQLKYVDKMISAAVVGGSTGAFGGS
jgi:cysteine synthase